MKHQRYISYLLLLCFSVYLGHSLVPHHHHSEVLQGPFSGDCPFEHSDHQGQEQNSESDTDKHPSPCHAFNNVAFEVNKAIVQHPDDGRTLALMLPGQPLVLEESPGFISNHLFLHGLPCRPSTDQGTRALRAPPASA